ncbi:PREDICTED: mitochondrial inner membrane protein OXA1-like [Populus euphratica]|uniref:Mitochondrial inner membrane protein OXA1-like n=1 Tax=Populus euphratica TaxID=75702 RepID=A0AAJ6UD22_POPEU|nr:PREDICTED: mitochondrial inner membrane protein OXA1-like [Populus euphratica]
MASVRSLSTRANIVRRRYNASFSYILHDDDRKHNSIEEGPSKGMSNLFQQRSFGSSRKRFDDNLAVFGFFHNRRCLDLSLSPSIGVSFCRDMSTIGGGSEDIELINDVADVLTDTTIGAVSAQAPVVNEVAIAAADSYFPVAALQHVIDAVHSFTGFNWWASIIVTTLLIRGATVPLLINQLKATTKLTLMRPHLEEIRQQMSDKAMDPMALAEGQKQMKKLFKEYGVSPLTPLKGLFIQGPIFVSFFLAISNMTEKVPSFKSGGAYWFLDLTTPDSLYILPILTGLTFWITVECNMQEGLEGNPIAGTMKKVSRVFAVASVPLTMGFPNAIFCYWVTSNLFSLFYGLALKAPGVKKFLGLPEIPVAPASTTPPSSFDLLEALKQQVAARQEPASPLPVEPSSKPSVHRISPASVLSQRLRSLEKQVKGRKKNNKR